jgi:hypothetical protein
MFRAKKWAQKAHRRRERRRAARQKEVGNQPAFPEDCPQRPQTVEDYGNKVEAETQPPIKDWAPPEGLAQGTGSTTGEVKSGQNGPISGNRETGGPIEAGDKERPRESEIPSQSIKGVEDQQDSQSIVSEENGEEDSDIPAEVNIKKRDACRLIRALRMVPYELRGPREGKAKKPDKKVYRACITTEDQVGVHHLQHRVGKKEELQTTLQHPHQFRNTLTRVYRLKNLR